jgi:predicted nuclease of predicted toxin-antitoxin system
VKFLVDAQLPARLAKFLTGKGHDAIHSSDLPDGNRTPDSEIALRADEDGRVVVTKDRDFRDTHLLHRTPRRLLVVATGNISNRDLQSLVAANLQAIVNALDRAHYVELRRDQLIIHES